MLMVQPFLLLAYASFFSSSAQKIVPDSHTELKSYCCHALQEKIPSIVHFPSSTEYQSRNAEYYSGQQQEQRPACSVKPKSSNDVSNILEVATFEQCPFAVVSGGHMCWKGSSNIDDGFLIDMKGLSEIKISPEDQMVKLGPGATWIDVYSALEPYNLSTAGGRISPVGVGGFLLGGGIAFASVDKGFGSNSVLNYEVVLSNGTIVNANEDSHSDLFWAMQLPSTNFGIVTRFDMRAYPSPEIWGALNMYPFSSSTASQLFAQFEKWGHNETNKENMVSVLMVRMKSQSFVMSVQSNGDGIRQEPLTSTPPVMHLETVGSTYKVINEVIDSTLAATTRTKWYTITTSIDTSYFLEIILRLQDIMKDLDDRENLLWSAGVQHFQKSFILGARSTPVFNALAQGTADLANILIRVEWSNPEDDLVLEEAATKLGTLAENEAAKRGILSNFIYLNSANGEQPVYERSVAPKDMERMRQIKNIYDTRGTFDELWKGGYKLPKQSGHDVARDTQADKHDEL